MSSALLHVCKTTFAETAVDDNAKSKLANFQKLRHTSWTFFKIDHGFSWKHQIENIFLKRDVCQFAPCNTLLRIYQSLILPHRHISYGLTA